MEGTSDTQLLGGFTQALLADRLSLAYQPKIDLATGKLVRVEALVRWDDPTFGAVPPARFVPLAERHGLIDPLTHWGLDAAFAQWRAWRDAGIDIGLAFNISAISLKKLNFPDLVEARAAAHGVPLDELVLELTESATQPFITLMDTLTRFRIKGIGLAIDDFGSGYSSLIQLRQLPFTELKIDRFFIGDATRSRESRAIIRSIITLAHDLGLKATGEGVESDIQLHMLRAAGADIAQGYRIAKPMAADDLPSFIERWERDWAVLQADEEG